MAEFLQDSLPGFILIFLRTPLYQASFLPCIGDTCSVGHTTVLLWKQPLFEYRQSRLNS